MEDRIADPSRLDSRLAWEAADAVVWLPTAEEMAELDRVAVASGATTERGLIESAGREIARMVARRWPEGPVVALAGSGHNGADALVALRSLVAWGREVAAVQGGSSPPSPDVLQGWPIALLPADRLEETVRRGSVLLDGLLGTGLTGPPRAALADLIERVNGLEVPVVAVDGPSGADFSTGRVPGACVRAALTICLGWPKLGLLRHPARTYCGEIVAVEIGFPPPGAPMGARAITGRWVREMLRPRPPGAHKGDAGYLALVAGQAGMAGAAALAARGALRGGVGIVRIISDPANREVLQAAIPGAIFAPWDDERAVRESLAWAHALVVGPGLGRGEERRRLVERVLELRGETPVLLDADALSVWPGELEALGRHLGPADLLTPHPGELARLSGETLQGVRADPPTAARRAAATAGCAVLLKGAPSVIAVGAEPLRVSTIGGPALAAGGTGDVLAGLAGAYLAAGMPPADAGSAALLISGVAAAASPEAVGHVAADLPDRLPSIRARVARLRRERNDAVVFAAAPDPPLGGEGLRGVPRE
ncbi:MAG: NAD(P)H-hydrate dehydratase [Gemmatimonadota bacterium]